MKNNFQSHIMLRLLVIISLMMGVVCVITLFLASLVPTQLLVATVTKLNNNQRHLAIVDGYSNRYLYLDYPLPTAQQGTIAKVELSANGRFASIYRRNGVRHELTFWDIFGGRVIDLPPDVCPQGVNADIGSNFTDSRAISFGCQEYDNTVLFYLFNFETQQTTLQYSFPVGPTSQIPTTIMRRSIDGSLTAELNLETKQIFISHADQSDPIEITPPNNPYGIAWHPNQQSLFALSENSLEQYTLNDQSWETIATDVQMSSDIAQTYMQFSPNAEWVMLFNGVARQGYMINLATRQMTTIDEASSSTFRPQFWWSPDSQWLAVTTHNPQLQPEAYVMRPDSSEITYFSDMVVTGLYWSPDSTQFVYRTYEDNDLYHVTLDTLSAQSLGFKLELGNVRWSENSESIVFVTYLISGRRRQLQLAYTQGVGETVFLLDDDLVVTQVEFVR